MSQSSTSGREFPDGYSLRRLDLYLQGELSPEERAAVERDLARDPALARYVESARGHQLGVSLAEFHRRAGRGRAVKPASRSEGRSFFPSARGAWALASLVVAVASVSYFVRRAEPETRFKGADWELRLQADAEEFAPGDTLRGADTLRLLHRGSAIYAQVWVRSAGGFEPAEAARDSARQWPRRTAWTPVPPLLAFTPEPEGEEIWVLTSSEAFTREDVRRARRDGSLPKRFAPRVFVISPEP